jgi:hypothetical protein
MVRKCLQEYRLVDGPIHSFRRQFLWNDSMATRGFFANLFTDHGGPAEVFAAE